MNTLSSTPLSLATLGGETMGTSWSVKLAVSPKADLHALHAGIRSKLDLVVRQMSTWETDSDISAYNRAAAGAWQMLPEEFFAVLSCALQIARDSDGAFDPSIGPLVALWGFGAHAQPRRAPGADTLDALRARIGWQRIELHGDTRHVLQPGGMQLDLSAIAKGYAVDLVATHLRDSRIESALVEVGGELFGYGRKPDGTPWRVLVETAPEEDDELSEPRVLDLDGMAIATSGDRWHRYDALDENGGAIRHSHSIDPRSGVPVAHAPAAVTVVASDAMHADAWATALTVMGARAGFDFAQARGLAARFVARDGDGLHETLTDAFKTHLAA
ncbi:MAG: FAD:protein FMN transferase [Pseudoxanthomonas sp.]